jgi:glutathione S-transferase
MNVKCREVLVQIYFSPLACSMAARITLEEMGGAAEFFEVDPKSKRIVGDDADYLEIYPLGLVPALRTDDGRFLTENAAILQYIADLRPEAGLAPQDPFERSLLHQWLCFIGTELHKALFVPLLDKKAPEAMKAYLLAKYEPRLAYLDAHLEGREYLLDRFSVADSYLTTVLNWTQVIPRIDLSKYPATARYLASMRRRPSIAKSMAAEAVLWRAELARHATAQ